MDRIRRNERMTAMMKLLSGKPNRIFTLNSFCELFGSAKSTMSEDVDLLQQVMKAFDLGEIETVTGAAGGVRYRPAVSREKARETREELKKVTLKIAAKGGANGKLFGSVSGKDVADALKAAHGVEIDKRKISLSQEVTGVGDGFGV